MIEHPAEIQSIPISSITVLNPRVRNKRIFNELVTSIAHLGLKKPITVSQRDGNGGYDLVCGQGRLEAFIALGQTDIPAVVVNVSKEDCFVMSLVENLARRHQTSLELMREIGALKARGYSHAQIAAKVDFSSEYVYAICYLLEHGEERLVAAVERGAIPPTIAIEIARAKESDVQAALAEVYETGAMPRNQMRAIRRIIEQRNSSGTTIHTVHTGSRKDSKKVTASVLVRSYRKQTERQKLLVKKATLAQSRLVFIVNALRSLLAEEHFTTLLRAEKANSLPKPLAERVERAGG
jgi:ParB family chromosome partitioning protein